MQCSAEGRLPAVDMNLEKKWDIFLMLEMICERRTKVGR